MKRQLSVTVILVFLVFFFATIPASAAKSYYAERFDVQIDLQENGSAIITETAEFHFSGDPFTFAFREISATETDGLTFLDASMDGVRLPRGSQVGQVEVEAGSALKVTWHFPPTSNAARIFTVRYRADGVIRKDTADALIWRAVPEDHEYSIDQATIVLTYPMTLSPLEQPTLDLNHDATVENGRVVLTARGIAADEDLIVTARFPLDSLSREIPQWHVQQERSRAATARALPIGLVAGITTVILGGIGLLMLTRANARDLNIPTGVSTASPPADLSAAIVGKLTGQQHNFMGAIFDLAQRGVLELREEKGLWGTSSHVLVRKDSNVALKPFEQGLLNALFKEGETQISLHEVQTRLAVKNSLFDEPLEQELIQRGWLDPERKQKKNVLTATGIVMIFISILVGVVGMVFGGFVIRETISWLSALAVLIGISAGLFILSIPVLIYAATFSTLTPSGEEQAARWKGFGQYLKDVGKGREAAVRPDYFEIYLAYAAVFGLGAAWAKYFQSLGRMPLPIWFHALAGSDDGFSAVVAVMSASDSAGVSAGGDGGGGASSGGSSGAG